VNGIAHLPRHRVNDAHALARIIAASRRHSSFAAPRLRQPRNSDEGVAAISCWWRARHLCAHAHRLPRTAHGNTRASLRTHSRAPSATKTQRIIASCAYQHRACVMICSSCRATHAAKWRNGSMKSKILSGIWHVVMLPRYNIYKWRKAASK